MRRMSRCTIGVFVLLCSCQPGLAFADESEQTDDEAPLEQGASVSPTRVEAGGVRIDPIRLTFVPEVPGAFRIPFRVTNTSHDRVELDTFSARFLASPESDAPLAQAPTRSDAIPGRVDAGDDYGAEGDEPSPAEDRRKAVGTVGSPVGVDGLLSCNAEQISLPPGGEMYVVCSYRPRVILDNPVDVLGLLGDWKTLTIQPGDYQVFAQARMRVQRTEGTFDFVESSTIAILPLRPTIWQVVMGVAFGALILAFFRVFSPKVRHDLGIAEGRLGFLSASWLGLRFWISAWIAGAMVVFITFRMQEGGLPIAITVNDFYGGVVIGLFGYVATLWVGNRVLGDSAHAGAPRARGEGAAPGKPDAASAAPGGGREPATAGSPPGPAVGR